MVRSHERQGNVVAFYPSALLEGVRALAMSALLWAEGF